MRVIVLWSMLTYDAEDVHVIAVEVLVELAASNNRPGVKYYL